MRPTPETDEVHRQCCRNPGPANGVILTNHGRRLERQRDELLEALERAARHQYVGGWVAVEKQVLETIARVKADRP